MLDPKIEKKARSWMEAEFSLQTREEVQELFDNSDWEELTERFYKDLEFGTGGIRGVLGAGTNRMKNKMQHMTVAVPWAEYSPHQLLAGSMENTAARIYIAAYNSTGVSSGFLFHSPRILF